MAEPTKYTHLVKRNLRRQWRDERRLAVRAETVSLGAVLMATLFAGVAVGNGL